MYLYDDVYNTLLFRYVSVSKELPQDVRRRT